MISQNQEAFMRMLTEGLPEDGPGAEQYITITPEENAAIDRVSQSQFYMK